MKESTKTEGVFNVIRRTFWIYRWQLLVLALLGFLSALLEGVGINTAVPLLGFLTNNGAPATDTISTLVAKGFHLLYIPYTFRTLLFFILFLFVARAVASVMVGYVRGSITAHFLHSETIDLLSRTLRASWSFLLGERMGTVQNTLTRDVQRSGNLLEVVSQVIQSSTGFVMYFVVAMNISYVTTLCTLAGGAVLVLVIRPFLKRIQSTGKDMALNEKEISKLLSEQILGMKSIKAAAAERSIFKIASDSVDSLRNLQVRLTFTKSISSSLFQPFTIGFIVIVFLISYHSPSFNIIAFGATLYLIQKMFTYLESAQSSFHVLYELVPYAGSILAFREQLARAEETDLADGKSFVFTSTLSLRNVSLSYPGRDDVLKEVTLTIPYGSIVALIGPSGAGKTSVADLVLRLFEPTAGQVLLDGVSSEEISRTEWRSHIGYVSQDAFLFNGTIADNIRFFRSDVSEDDLLAAARQANLYDFVNGLPEGFGTVLGDRGMTLSGGQRQRVVLARALAGKPELLVLDEATSALDSESERLIHDAIYTLRGTVTVLLIAHRLSTVERADQLIVLSEGCVLENGSPKELLQKSDSYFSQQYSKERSHSK
jgi:ABC-type multidrug transport system fused ATPase/permease subunit